MCKVPRITNLQSSNDCNIIKCQSLGIVYLQSSKDCEIVYLQSSKDCEIVHL